MLSALLLNIITTSIYTNENFSPKKIEYIKAKYEHTMFGKEFLFYPAQEPKRLLIFFNGATKNRYMMFSWFWNDKEIWKDTAYLFLKDDTTCWYLGNNEISLIEDFSRIINHHISFCKLTKTKYSRLAAQWAHMGLSSMPRPWI